MFIPLLLSSCALAQEPIPLMEVGDPIANSAHFAKRFDKLQINNSGDWLAQALWDPGINQFCLIRNGALEAEFRASLPDGPGTGVRWNSTPGIAFNEAGETFFSLGFSNNPSGLLDDEGLYFGFQNLIALEGAMVLDPAVPSGSVWHDWDDVVLNNTNTVLINADYRDSSTNLDRRVFVKVSLDGNGEASGVEEVLVGEGSIVDGDPVISLSVSSRQMDMNDAGDVIVNFRLGPAGPQESVIWMDGQLIARDGEASPVPGAEWSGLNNAQVAVNDRGDYAITGSLASSQIREGIFVNGQPFILYGDQLADIAPFELRRMNGRPVDIADTGDVLWWGEFNDTNTATNNALFLNDRVLVRAGVTQIGGATVEDLDTGEYGYFLSDNGRYVIFEATLSDGREGLYQIDLDPDPTLLPVQPGVAGQLNTATVLNLQPSARVLLGASRSLGNESINCGLGLIESGLAAPVFKVASLIGNVNGEASITRFVNASQVGTTWYLQALDLTNCRVSNVVATFF